MLTFLIIYITLLIPISFILGYIPPKLEKIEKDKDIFNFNIEDNIFLKAFEEEDIGLGLLLIVLSPILCFIFLMFLFIKILGDKFINKILNKISLFIYKHLKEK